MCGIQNGSDQVTTFGSQLYTHYYSELRKGKRYLKVAIYGDTTIVVKHTRSCQIANLGYTKP